jgi:hypothetical protein
VCSSDLGSDENFTIAFFGDFGRDFVDTGHNDQGDDRHSQNDEYCFEHKKPPHLIDRRLRSDFSQNRDNIFLKAQKKRRCGL